MRLPSSLKFGHRRFKVRKLDLVTAMSESILGRVNRYRGEIEVVTEQRIPADIAEVLLHEVFHVLVYDSGLGSAGMPLEDDDVEEIVVGRLATELVRFMADNKAVVRKMLEAL